MHAHRAQAESREDKVTVCWSDVQVITIEKDDTTRPDRRQERGQGYRAKYKTSQNQNGKSKPKWQFYVHTSMYVVLVGSTKYLVEGTPPNECCWLNCCALDRTTCPCLHLLPLRPTLARAHHRHQSHQSRTNQNMPQLAFSQYDYI